jgi:hypothetical protein
MTAQITNSNTEKIIIIAGLAIVGYVVYKSSKAIGAGLDSVGDIFGSGSEAKAADTAIEIARDNNTPWKGSYLLDLQATLPKGSKINYLTAKAKKDFSERIQKAVSPLSGGIITGAIIGAKPSDLIDVFQQINTKSQVADLALYFQQKYGKDLLTFITEGLRSNQPLTMEKNNKTLQSILKRVSLLKSY